MWREGLDGNPMQNLYKKINAKVQWVNEHKEEMDRKAAEEKAAKIKHAMEEQRAKDAREAKRIEKEKKEEEARIAEEGLVGYTIYFN